MYVEAAQAALLAYEHRDSISGIFASLAHIIKHGRTRVMVIGPGGTGKTTLSYRMAGKSGEKIVGAYNVSSGKETKKLDDVPLGSVVTIPGQPGRRERQAPEIHRMLSKDHIDGIIHVVAYGFHSLEVDSYTEHRLYQSGQTTQDFMDVYLPEMRAEEVQVVHEIRTAMTGANTVPWMITLVCKQDLWWAGRTTARAHYEHGAYADAIALMEKDHGANRFVHDIASGALEILNLTTNAHEVLATTVSGYDQRHQGANLDVFDRLLRTRCNVQDG